VPLTAPPEWFLESPAICLQKSRIGQKPGIPQTIPTQHAICRDAENDFTVGKLLAAAGWS
jgi:hypothetical protein